MNKINNLKDEKNIKITSFLTSLVIWIIAFWTTNKYFSHDITLMLILSIIVTVISYPLVNKKFKEIEKNRPWLFTYLFFNKMYTSKGNHTWFETFAEVVKEVKKESINFPSQEKQEYKPENKNIPNVLLETHKDTYLEWKKELSINEYKKNLLEEKNEWLDEMLNLEYSSEDEKNAVKKGIELIKEYIDSELKY